MGRKYNELHFTLGETPSSTTSQSAVNDPGAKNVENDQSFKASSQELDNSSNPFKFNGNLFLFVLFDKARGTN